MHNGITILNFNNTYKEQNFYNGKKCTWLDFSKLSGVNAYCDNSSLKAISNQLKQKNPSKVCFIGSGNYHYVSLLLIEQIKEPFTLILFDHHTDMQPPHFEPILSCGCWVKKALEQNIFLKKVIIIGAGMQMPNLPDKYIKKVDMYSEQTVSLNDLWMSKVIDSITYPVYVSIDKDVFNSKETKTDWDHGVLTLEQLKKMYGLISMKHRILGVDICGEFSGYENLYYNYKSANELNNKANKLILSMIEKEHSLKELA